MHNLLNKHTYVTKENIGEISICSNRFTGKIKNVMILAYVEGWKGSHWLYAPVRLLSEIVAVESAEQLASYTY